MFLDTRRSLRMIIIVLLMSQHAHGGNIVGLRETLFPGSMESLLNSLDEQMTISVENTISFRDPKRHNVQWQVVTLSYPTGKTGVSSSQVFHTLTLVCKVERNERGRLQDESVSWYRFCQTINSYSVENGRWKPCYHEAISGWLWALIHESSRVSPCCPKTYDHVEPTLAFLRPIDIQKMFLYLSENGDVKNYMIQSSSGTFAKCLSGALEKGTPIATAVPKQADDHLTKTAIDIVMNANLRDIEDDVLAMDGMIQSFSIYKGLLPETYPISDELADRIMGIFTDKLRIDSAFAVANGFYEARNVFSQIYIYGSIDSTPVLIIVFPKSIISPEGSHENTLDAFLRPDGRVFIERTKGEKFTVFF